MMIKGKNVVKTFDALRALDGLSINVPKGSVYGLVGPNGAGKTTLIKTLMGILRCDSGEIIIDSVKNPENAELKQKIIYVSDDLYFYPGFSIRDTAKFYSLMYKNWDNVKFEKLKSVFNIDVSRKVRKLSKGMKKQVAFWMGICATPEIMILDEPVDGLDPVMRRSIMNIILQDVEERGMTVLISSHNLRELEDVCDHVGIMHGGKIVLEKSLDDVKGNIHKLQIAFEGDIPEALEKKINILKKDEFGSIRQYILRGDSDEIIAAIKEFNPVICDILPLSLEEVFIYELGGMGYELKNEII